MGRTQLNDTGGTVRIYPSSHIPVDVSRAITISVWIHDTQGNNTVQLMFHDDHSKASNTVWSSMRTAKNAWGEVTWFIDEFKDVDMRRITNIELYEWNDGVYYFDSVSYR